MYRTEDPTRDAYHVYGQQRRREERRDAFMSDRIAELQRIVRGVGLIAIRVESMTLTYPEPITYAHDMADWLAESADPTGAMLSLLIGNTARDELLDRYCVARAAWESSKRDWAGETLDDLAWQSAGMV